jgi:drug/metabolite transporter (DMT)-like permease
VAWVWLKDRPNATRMVGLAIGFGGVAMLAWDKVSFQPVAGGTATGWAVMACLFACVCYGLAASITKRFATGVPPLVMAAGSQLGATVALAPLTICYWPDQPASHAAWLAALALGVLCTGSAYLLFFRLIQRAGPARTLSVTFAIPMFAVLYGVVFFGEVVTPWMVTCALVIVAGTSMSSGMWGSLPWPRRLDAAAK